MLEPLPFLSDRVKRLLDLFAAAVAVGISLTILVMPGGEFLRGVPKEEYLRKVAAAVASVRNLDSTPPAFEFTVVGHRAVYVYGSCGEVVSARRALEQPAATAEFEVDPIPLAANDRDRYRVLAINASGFSKTYDQCLRAMGWGVPTIFKIFALPILLGAAYRVWRAVRLMLHR